ncbi:glycosyltransferase family 2 protein [Demequina sp.]|uniref:glycosyltransferase family 2 protein n=1 Tax=Demequina sp. TaxID=2050685 RepID=UPI003A8AC7C1
MTRDRSVSVIIPAHNAAQFIGTAMGSLVHQFDDPTLLQVIVIDDGSTDGTADIARTFEGRVGSIEVITHASPEGVGTARVVGLEAADRAHVAFLDADDWWAPGRLPSLVDRLHALDVDYVRTDHVRVFDDGSPREIHRAPDGRRERALRSRDTVLPVDASSLVDYPFPWAGLFHRKLVEDGSLAYDRGLHSFEDRVAIWRLALSDAAVAVVDAPWAMYRRSVATSLTQVYDSRQLDFIKGFATVRDLVISDGNRDFEAKMVRQFLAISAHHVGRQRGMTRDVKGQLRTAIGDFARTLDPAMLRTQWEAAGSARRALLRSAIAPVLSQEARA